MTIAQADVDALLAELDRSRQAWIEGRISWTESELMDQADDMTIFGPFGGEAGRADNAKQARTAAMFRGGAGSAEVVKVIVEANIVVVVAVERNEVMFEGESATRPWILRTTQVFRHEDGRWVRLHRHADPLIHRRSLVETRHLLDR
jgi:hypothetical protein